MGRPHFVDSNAAGYVGHFHGLDTVNCAAMNRCVHILTSDLTSCGSIPDCRHAGFSGMPMLFCLSVPLGKNPMWVYQLQTQLTISVAWKQTSVYRIWSHLELFWDTNVLKVQ